MSDVMLFGVLKMPYEMAMATELSRFQFYQRVQELVERVESQPERTWVGLTDDEIDQGLVRTNYAMQTAGAWRDGVDWATKQLREKNNG